MDFFLKCLVFYYAIEASGINVDVTIVKIINFKLDLIPENESRILTSGKPLLSVQKINQPSEVLQIRQQQKSR